MRLNGLFFGFPARSHTVPGLPVVRALIDRNVRIRYWSTPQFRSLIEDAGAEFAAYPADFEVLGTSTDVPGHVERVLEITARHLPQLLADARTETASLVLFDSQALWGRVIGQELAVPTAASITTFALTRAMLQLLSHGREGRLDGPRVLAGLARLGRSDIRDYADVLVPSADLKLIYTSRFFQPGGRYFDSSHLFVGPLLEARPRAGVKIAVSGPRPLAYVTFGTIFTEDVGLLRRISGILSEAGWQVVVSLGDRNRTVSGDWPPNVEVHAFVDQMAMLSNADLVVTHGGMATVSEALASGVPTIIVPHSIDQHLVGRRATDLGAAMVIDDASSVALWASTLGRIALERPRFAAAAARVGDSFSDVVPVGDAVQRILDLAKAKT